MTATEIDSATRPTPLVAGIGADRERTAQPVDEQLRHGTDVTRIARRHYD